MAGPTPKHVAEKVASRMFQQRGSNRVEIHISEADLAATIEAAIELYVQVGKEPQV
jgi:hypothetical protein